MIAICRTIAINIYHWVQKIVASVRDGAKRIVIGRSERSLDVWSRLCPETDGGWFGRLVRNVFQIGLTMGKTEWAALVVGCVLGLEAGLHMPNIARL